jgi:hypothetical protein
MQRQNTVRQDDNSTARGGLYLVYSYDWTPERQAREAAQIIKRQDGLARRERGTSVKAEQGALEVKWGWIAAAFGAPLVWAGLKLMHIL